MNLISLLLMGILIYSFTFCICISLKIYIMLKSNSRKMSFLSWVKAVIDSFTSVLLFPIYIAYKKVVKKQYPKTSIIKLYFILALLTPELLDISVNMVVQDKSTYRSPVAPKKPISISNVLQSTFCVFNDELGYRYS